MSGRYTFESVSILLSMEFIRWSPVFNDAAQAHITLSLSFIKTSGLNCRGVIVLCRENNTKRVSIVHVNKLTFFQNVNPDFITLL